MPRKPPPEPDDRNRRQVSWRIDNDLVDRLLTAAYERAVHPQLLVDAALREFLDNLIPVEELSWTRRHRLVLPSELPPMVIPPYATNEANTPKEFTPQPMNPIRRSGNVADAHDEVQQGLLRRRARRWSSHCPDCDHAVVFHDSDGCTMTECPCTTVGGQEND